MSLRAVRWAKAQRAGSATAKAVLLVLAEAADASGQAFPSQQEIAEVLELTDRSVRAALATLETAGLIETGARYRKGGSRQSNRYRLSIPEGDSGSMAEGGSGKEAYRKEIPGGIPEGDSALVPTVLEPTTPPPVVPPQGDLTNGSASKRRGRRCPPSFTPNDGHRALARERGVSLEEELAKFRDHEFDRPKSDWDATFRNWLRNAWPIRAGPAPPDRSLYLRPDEIERRPPQKTRMQVEHEERQRRAGSAP